MIAQTPQAPYYAVIFTSSRTEGDQGYAEAAARMVELAQRQPGFLGAESVRGDDGVGITVSYWTSEAAILAWKNHPEHQAIRERGRSTWYSAFHTRVCKVERDYRFG
ncbi:antibiotic biosynthesis monooxygenase [Pseudomonas sp. COR58]|uniref:Antibiotic biosynthesis monooxygenase n=1 Tax=Pseudomonas ekonensis TaxID=2842353 RepID=A0ABS6P9H7_9PSED|nr:antibiotic biosynthesis monooxygenase [Pseudomonas ekonensis]MBV4457125.1 antibiotic biosynthesis monooxygenase [Pseudomonas ekonensis]